MKALVIAAITCVVLFTEWGQDVNDPFAPEAGKGHPRHRLAKDFGACPDGHKALKDVPIIYGLVGPLHKKPEDYNEEDKKLKGQYDRGEVAFGGCVSEEHSPKFQVRCQTCGYAFDDAVEVFDKEITDFSSWSRSSPNPNKFRLAFSERLREVPMVDVVNGSVSCRQSIDADGKEVKSETVTYQSTAAAADLVANTWKWMEEQKLNPALLKGMEDAAAFHTYMFEGETISVHIMDDRFWNPGKVRVSFSERRRPPQFRVESSK